MGHGAPSILTTRSYAQALHPDGQLFELPSAGSWLSRRPIPRSGLYDAIGVYPYSECRNWRGLLQDFSSLSPDLVTVTMVSAPESGIAPADLAGCFDLIRAYKRHWIVDLEEFDPTGHHRRESRRALRRLSVSLGGRGAEELEQWRRLYQGLCLRHGVAPSTSVDPSRFAALFRHPAIRVYEARSGHDICAMALWLLDADQAHYYLAASDDVGYHAGAGYALMQVALEHFAREGYRLACLGSVPDGQGEDSGLARFKGGWTRRTGQTYLCGRILRPDLYRQLSGQSSPEHVGFPAYRFGKRS